MADYETTQEDQHESAQFETSEPATTTEPVAAHTAFTNTDGTAVESEITETDAEKTAEAQVTSQLSRDSDGVQTLTHVSANAAPQPEAVPIPQAKVTIPNTFPQSGPNTPAAPGATTESTVVTRTFVGPDGQTYEYKGQGETSNTDVTTGASTSVTGEANPQNA